MKGYDRFNKHFDRLTQQEKADYAKAFVSNLNKTMDKINKDNFESDERNRNRKDGDLQKFELNEAINFEHKKMEARILDSKREHLDVFNYCDLETLSVLTPEMDEGIKGFFNDYVTDKFRIAHSFTDYQDRISDAIFKSHTKIQRVGIVERINEEFPEHNPEIKQEKDLDIKEEPKKETKKKRRFGFFK